MDAPVEKLLIHGEYFCGNTRAAAQGGVETDAHHGPYLLHGAVGADAQRVAVDEVAVIGLKELWVELLVLVPAHAPVQAVNRLALRRHIEEDLTGPGGPFQGLGLQLHRTALIGHLAQGLQGEGASV